MNAQTQSSGYATPARNNALWAAIAVLAVAVVALASALYYVQSREAQQHPVAVSPVPNPVTVLPAPTAEAMGTAPAESKTAVTEKKPAAGKAAASRSNKPVAQAQPGTPTSAATSAPSPTPAAKEVCLNCATVTAVKPLEREGTPSGAGVVAGGVLGALVGNQFGGGDGKTLATIAGAVGGGIAGNTVEKKMKKTTVYQVELRMDNGDMRSIEQAAPVGVGARVRVEGNALYPLTN
jgi:outer membrane lipoprotein SlyB